MRNSFDIRLFHGIVDSFHEALKDVPAELTSIRLRPDAWSLREIVGHLVDSASNNHQRFVRLQQGDLRNFSAYDGEKWILIQKTNGMDWGLLVELWHDYNRLLLHVIDTMEDQSMKNRWFREDGDITLESLVYDYFEHMKIHTEHFRKRLEEVRGSTQCNQYNSH
jgi:hypothetical protein